MEIFTLLNIDHITTRMNVHEMYTSTIGVDRHFMQVVHFNLTIHVAKFIILREPRQLIKKKMSVIF